MLHGYGHGRAMNEMPPVHPHGCEYELAQTYPKRSPKPLLDIKSKAAQNEDYFFGTAVGKRANCYRWIHTFCQGSYTSCSLPLRSTRRTDWIDPQRDPDRLSAPADPRAPGPPPNGQAVRIPGYPSFSPASIAELCSATGRRCISGCMKASSPSTTTTWASPIFSGRNLLILSRATYSGRSLGVSRSPRAG